MTSENLNFVCPWWRMKLDLVYHELIVKGEFETKFVDSLLYYDQANCILFDEYMTWMKIVDHDKQDIVNFNIQSNIGTFKWVKSMYTVNKKKRKLFYDPTDYRTPFF